MPCKQCRFPKESAGLSLIPPDDRPLVVGGELLSCVGERQLSWRGAQMELSWRAQALPAACGSPELNSRELSWRAQLIGTQMIRAQLESLQHAYLNTAQWAGHSVWAQLELTWVALAEKAQWKTLIWEPQLKLSQKREDTVEESNQGNTQSSPCAVAESQAD